MGENSMQISSKSHCSMFIFKWEKTQCTRPLTRIVPRVFAPPAAITCAHHASSGERREEHRRAHLQVEKSRCDATLEASSQLIVCEKKINFRKFKITSVIIVQSLTMKNTQNVCIKYLLLLKHIITLYVNYAMKT